MSGSGGDNGSRMQFDGFDDEEDHGHHSDDEDDGDDEDENPNVVVLSQEEDDEDDYVSIVGDHDMEASDDGVDAIDIVTAVAGLQGGSADGARRAVRQWAKSLEHGAAVLAKARREQQMTLRSGPASSDTACLYANKDCIKLTSLVTELNLNKQEGQKLLTYLHDQWKAGERALPKQLTVVKARTMIAADALIRFPVVFKEVVVSPDRAQYPDAPDFIVLTSPDLFACCLGLLLERSSLATEHPESLLLAYEATRTIDGSERLYGKANQGDCWQRAEVDVRRRCKNPDVSVMPVVLYTDAVLVDQGGKTSCVPAYITICNLPLTEMESDRGKLCVAQMGVVKKEMLGKGSSRQASSVAAKRSEVRRIKQAMINEVGGSLAAAYKAAVLNGGIAIAIGVGDMIVKFVPFLTYTVMDTEERHKALGVRGTTQSSHPCGICMVPRDKLNVSHYDANAMVLRTEATMGGVRDAQYTSLGAAEEATKKLGIHPTNGGKIAFADMPLYSLGDQYSLSFPERLHQMELGPFKRCLDQVKDVLKIHGAMAFTKVSYRLINSQCMAKGIDA
jgi:hypothetical protein